MTSYLENHKVTGSVLAALAAVFWGVSGALGQFLLVDRGINTEWLVAVRLLISGVILLVFAGRHGPFWLIWYKKADALQLVIFSIFGVLAVQYTFFSAIRYSNAATATVLQSTAPVIIATFFTLKHHKKPSITECLAIMLALCGTFLLVTHGCFDRLTISGKALFWGLATAITLAFYSLYPETLLKRYLPTTVIGWAMLIGGISFSFVHAPWLVKGRWDLYTYSATAFIILFATVFAFYAFLIAVKYIGAQQTSLLASIEPLTAAVIAVTWLGVPFSWIDWLGCSCIIATIIVLGIKR